MLRKINWWRFLVVCFDDDVGKLIIFVTLFNLKIRNEFAISETVIVGDTPDYLYPKIK